MEATATKKTGEGVWGTVIWQKIIGKQRAGGHRREPRAGTDEFPVGRGDKMPATNCANQTSPKQKTHS